MAAACYIAEFFQNVAIWAQNKFKLGGPPPPKKYLNNGGSFPTNMTTINITTNVIYVDAAAVVPQGATAVLSGQNYYVDPDIWEIQDPAGGPVPSESTATETTEPIFPTPSCNPNASGGIDPDAAITALGQFCTQQTGTVQPSSQPISQTYAGGQGPGGSYTIRLTLSWDASEGSCPASQSPTQNDGRIAIQFSTTLSAAALAIVTAKKTQADL